MSKAPQIFSWFIRQVEKGLAQIKRGELLEHDEVTPSFLHHITHDKPDDNGK